MKHTTYFFRKNSGASVSGNVLVEEKHFQVLVTHINWGHFVEEKGTGNDNLHVVVGTNDSFVELYK